MDWRHKLPGKRELLILALLFLLPFLAFSALFLSNTTLYESDLTSIHYPLKVFQARLLSSGQIPLWNPYIEFGFPQLADQDVLALHPLNLLFLLPLKPHLTLSLFIVVHFVLAGVFSYAMARALRMSRGGAFITAVTFALGGYLMAQVTNLPIMTGSVWLPLIFFLFVKALDTNRLIYAILCGGAIALQILASHPQVVFYSLLALGAYGAFRLIQLWTKEEAAIQAKGRKALVHLSLMAVAILVGLALAAIQIVPTWELKGWTARAAGLDYVLMTMYSLPPYNLLTFLFPNVLGNPVIGYTGPETFEEMHTYVGVLPLMLMLWAWAKKERDSHVTFFAILAGGSLLLALGHYTPLYHLLAYVPGFNFFRAPARWLLTATFALSVLAGCGFDTLIGSRERPESRPFALFWRIFTWLNVALIFLLLAGLAFGQQAIQLVENLRGGLLSDHTLDRTLLLVRGLTRLPLVQFSDDLSTTLSSLNPTVLFVLVSGSGLLLIYLWNNRRLSAAIFGILVVGLIVVDLLLTGGTTVNLTRDAAYYEREIGTTIFLQQNSGLHRIFPHVYTDDVESLWEDMPTAYELYSVRGHISELALERYKVLLDVLDRSAALRNLSGIKYVLLEQGSSYPGYLQAYLGNGMEIYENESVLPRAMIVHQAEVVSPEQAVLERLLRDDFDPTHIVILEEEPAVSLDRVSPLPEQDPAAAQITFYSPHRIVIEADLKADGFLVLADTYFPGWQAFVDGQEERIYQADYLFRAIFLEEGKHRVEFKYSPLSFRVGLAISLITGVLLCGIAVYSVRVRRRQGERGESG